jgi:hypothetical protein
VAAIKILSLPDQFGIPVHQQSGPAVVNDKVGGVTFHAVPGANLGALLVGGAQHGEDEQQDAVFIRLREHLEPDLVEPGQRAAGRDELPVGQLEL